MFLRGGYSLLEGVRLYPSEAVRHEYRTFQRRVADQDIDVEAVARALEDLGRRFGFTGPDRVPTLAATEFAFIVDPRRVNFDELKVALALALEPLGTSPGSLAAAIDGIVRQQTAILSVSGKVRTFHMLFTIPKEGWTVTARGQFRSEKAKEAEARELRSELEKKALQKDQRTADKERRWAEMEARVARDDLARHAAAALEAAGVDKQKAERAEAMAERARQQAEAAEAKANEATARSEKAQREVLEAESRRAAAEAELVQLRAEQDAKTGEAHEAEVLLDKKGEAALLAEESEVVRLRRELAEAQRALREATEAVRAKPVAAKPKPAAAKPARAKPVVVKRGAKPVATRAKPVVVKRGAKPVVVKRGAKPVATRAKPVVVKRGAKPVVVKRGAKPVATRAKPVVVKPVASRAKAKPVKAKSEAKPMRRR